MQTIDTLTVYLGSSGRARDVYQKAAIDLGHAIAAAEKKLVYGGMDAGLMGLLAITAQQDGAAVTGVIPDKLKDSERLLPNLMDEIHVDTLAQRKALMFEKADAVIALPGGFGTLDESLEVLYWANLKLHGKPLVFINIENYWGALLEYLTGLPDYDPRFLLSVDSIDALFPALEAWEPIPGSWNPPHDYPHFEDIIAADDSPIIFDTPNMEQSYYMMTALGLKQLGKHARPIGILNEGGQFNGMIDWIKTAHEEKFITDKCVRLFDVTETMEELQGKLAKQNAPSIDLHAEKWGERRKNPRG